jgi:hypothetical protein
VSNREKFLLAIGILAFISFGIVLLGSEFVSVRTGVVAAKYYHPSTMSTTSLNGPVPVVVSSSSQEKWLLIVGSDAFNVDPSIWGQVEVGDEVEIVERRGAFGGYGRTLRVSRG